MTHEFSSYQLVFGKNPREGSTTSEILATHFNNLHAARRAFMQSETEKRIRRALRSTVKTAEEHYTQGKMVHYKREGQEKWLEPEKVIFQERKVIFVRHGTMIIDICSYQSFKSIFAVEFISLRGPNMRISSLLLTKLLRAPSVSVTPLLIFLLKY